jgi:hypothetical protein
VLSLSKHVNSNHVGDGAFYGQDEFLGSFDFSQGLLSVLVE